MSINLKQLTVGISRTVSTAEFESVRLHFEAVIDTSAKTVDDDLRITYDYLRTQLTEKLQDFQPKRAMRQKPQAD